MDQVRVALVAQRIRRKSVGEFKPDAAKGALPHQSSRCGGKHVTAGLDVCCLCNQSLALPRSCRAMQAG